MHFGRVEPCGGIVSFLIVIHADFSVYFVDLESAVLEEMLLSDLDRLS